MCDSGSWIFRKMGVTCSIFKLLLFQMLVAWCGAKHVAFDDMLRIEIPASEQEVHNSIRNLMHTGIYSHRHLDPAQTQLVHPVKVTHGGELVSHQLDHEHEHGHARARRDLHQAEHKLAHMLHYNLTVDGRELRLDLRPSVTFITPAMIVERHRAGSQTRGKPHPKATSCHYTGSVRGQAESRVAISACDGLAGLLRTEHGEYWIEPSNHIPTEPSEARPHVVFKRAAVNKVDAWHRAKREIDRNRNKNDGNTHRSRPNGRRSRDSKEMIDRRRREYLEARRKQLEELRKNPYEYRKHQMAQRIEQRRPHLTHKAVNSSSGSRSSEMSESLEGKTKHRNRSANESRPRRIRPKNRKRRNAKNCATKQPPYHWDKKSLELEHERQLKRKYEKDRRQRPNQSHKRRQDEARRSARSVSKPRHVEVLLVADNSMYDIHHNNKSRLETYLLTIMNMVSSLYMDPSIGNFIKVVVVKIILLEELHAAANLEVSKDADATLSSFCSWQHQLNPDNDTDPHHHDVAILVTREDICSQHDAPCSTLGVAHVAGMCNPERSCSVNEDNGVMLAHTITHELGHNFGLYHDTKKIGCHRREGATLHIMTPIFESDTMQVAWSRCSKRDVTNFFDAGLLECLDDRPSQEEYEYPRAPAGEIIDSQTQCLLLFGTEAPVCDQPALCSRLWCFVNNSCISMLRPAAPGTLCGENMWCQNQECVPRTPLPQPRDGAWGEWSEWSECSRTCGAGVSTQSRECNNPEPSNSGKYCIGERSRYKVCNTDPCSINEPGFREVQCSRFNNNNITYRNETISEWIPYFNQDKPCELQCMPRSGNNVEMVGGFAADGTPCRQTDGAREMCIAGVCHKVGCDWVVDSSAEEDRCGVCGGNGSACSTVQGIYSKGPTKQSGYSEVAVIPAGSRNVKIQEKVSPGNYISIGSAKSRKLYLSGVVQNQTMTEYFVAGSQAIYERDRDWEKVRILGPIAEDIKVYQRIYRGKHRNAGVTYQYTVDKKGQKRRYRYRLSDWSPCSVTCGEGVSRRHLQCVDEHDRLVEQSQCYHIEAPRHEAEMARCRQPACPATPPQQTHWWVSPWRACSKPCRMPGDEPTKHRSVYCVEKATNQVVSESACDASTKPLSDIKCADVPPC